MTTPDKAFQQPAEPANGALRFCLLVLYYLGIIAGLIALYGRGDFSTPPFVYQGF